MGKKKKQHSKPRVTENTTKTQEFPAFSPEVAKALSDGINSKVKSSQDESTGQTLPIARDEAAKRLNGLIGAMLKKPETVKEHLERLGVTWWEESMHLCIPIKELEEAEAKEKSPADKYYAKQDPTQFQYKPYDEENNE